MNPASAIRPAANPSVAKRVNHADREHLTWLRGKHSLTMGGSWTQYDLWLKNQQLVPEPVAGIDGGGLPNLVTGDPALALFNAANFPGASADHSPGAEPLRDYHRARDAARRQRGDWTRIRGNMQYPWQLRTQRARMREAGFFFQDSWRVRPDLTINAGLRYELQFPFTPRNDSYSTATARELLRPVGDEPGYVLQPVPAGQSAGCPPDVHQLRPGTPAYNTDYNNCAPSVGVAWTLKGSDRTHRARMFGRNEGDSVLRGGFTRAFSREGMANFSDRYGGKPRRDHRRPTRSQALGNLGGAPVAVP